MEHKVTLEEAHWRGGTRGPGVSFGYADADHPVNSFRTTRVDLPAHAVEWFSD